MKRTKEDSKNHKRVRNHKTILSQCQNDNKFSRLHLSIRIHFFQNNQSVLKSRLSFTKPRQQLPLLKIQLSHNEQVLFKRNLKIKYFQRPLLYSIHFKSQLHKNENPLELNHRKAKEYQLHFIRVTISSLKRKFTKTILEIHQPIWVKQRSR